MTKQVYLIIVSKFMKGLMHEDVAFFDSLSYANNFFKLHYTFLK